MNQTGYQILGDFYENIGEYAISSIKLEDAEPIRLWRNQQISALRQSNILSKDEQRSYFKNVIEPSFSDKNPKQILLRYTFNKNLIGYGGLVHLNWTDLKGGVIGGSLFNGTIKVNDIIEVRPGICGKGKDGKLISQPIKSKVLSVKTDQEELDKIFPGGLMGIGTDIDPYYCKDDMLAGNMIGLEGTLPSVYDSVELKYNIIEDFGGSWKPTVNDSMFLQIGTLSISSILTQVNKENIKLNLSRPACIDKDMNIIVSHKENGIMKIVASGTLYSGNKIVD